MFYFAIQEQRRGVLTTTAGDDVLRDVTAFLDSGNIVPTAAAGQQRQTPGSVSSAEIEFDFDVPPGYISILDWNDNFHSPAKIAIHPVSAPNINFFLAAVSPK